MTSGNLNITARAMVSSLGLDAANSCAAARAGLSRAGALENATFLSDEDGQKEQAVGHRAPIITYGFIGRARIYRLIEAGVRGLKESIGQVPIQQEKTAWYLSHPPSKRSILSSNSSDSTRGETEDCGSAELSKLTTDCTELIQRACCAADWNIRPNLRSVSTREQSGFAEVLCAAEDDLRNGKIDIAIVGAVDSLVEQETIDTLYSRNRLKSSACPVGISPGEACAFVVIQSDQSMRRCGTVPKALISAIRQDRERVAFADGGKPTGEAMCRMLVEFCKSEMFSPDGQLWIISDQNGEHHRAYEWGCTIVRLIGELGHEIQPVVWSVPESFGDVGSASGIFATNLALSAFERGYAPCETAVMLSVSDGEFRSMIEVQNPGASATRG